MNKNPADYNNVYHLFVSPVCLQFHVCLSLSVFVWLPMSIELLSAELDVPLICLRFLPATGCVFLRGKLNVKCRFKVVMALFDDLFVCDGILQLYRQELMAVASIFRTQTCIILSTVSVQLSKASLCSCHSSVVIHRGLCSLCLAY